MIPKKIHYCWFGGGEMSESMQECMESWKKFCPDYELIEWNEARFDVRCNRYAREAYEAEKWAFVADMVRLYALVTEGGVYLDTDVELVKPLDGLTFSAGIGFESDSLLSTAFMAAERGNPCFEALLAEYDGLPFIKEDGTPDLTTNVERVTEFFASRGLRRNGMRQEVAGVAVLPSEYFSPKDFQTGKLQVTENTYAIHRFEGSWLCDEDRTAEAFKRRYAKYMPTDWAGRCGKFFAISKYRGVRAAMRAVAAWTKRKSGR